MANRTDALNLPPLQPWQLQGSDDGSNVIQGRIRTVRYAGSILKCSERVCIRIHDHDTINVQAQNAAEEKQPLTLSMTPIHDNPKSADRETKNTNDHHLQLLTRPLAGLAGLLGQEV
jgi:hypothetical protein